MSLTPLDGPRLAAQGAPRHLIVLVHGYGADGNDLIGLAPHLQRRLPDAAFAAPNAPELVPGAAGYQWFPIARMDPHEMAQGVEAAAPALERFIESELARLGLGPDRLALVGFSQGTMLSLPVGLRLGCAAVVGFSGLLAAPVPPAATPVFLAHGDSDTVIPPQALFLAAGALGAAGCPVQWHLAAGMGHGIDPDGLAFAADFLAAALAGAFAGAGPFGCPVTEVSHLGT